MILAYPLAKAYRA